MYTRSLTLPNRSFFLFGPRSTGKTTWLREQLPGATWFDLLRMQTVLELTRVPETFRSRIEALPHRSWVVIDEIQRLPTLLHEVHAIMSERGPRYRFAITGSSARKLRRLDIDLLAGRAIQRRFFPLTGQEMEYQFALDDLLAFGCLPNVRSEPDVAVDILEAYVATYLQEEIQQEALTKAVGAFARFLEVAALTNGQVVNVAGVARDAGVARPTVARYYDVLVDTLVGFWLPAWRSKARIKEVRHPKFFFFDCGVVRGALGRLRDPLEAAERGPLLETLVLHELRAAMNLHNTGGDLAYWRTPSGSEIDFVWSRGKRRIGIEVKASQQWRRDSGAPLRELVREGALTAGYAVYTGANALRDPPISVLPVKQFMRQLAEGSILG